MAAADVAELRAAFEAEYRHQFARAVPGMTIEILNWAVRVSTVGKPEPRLVRAAAGRDLTPAASRSILCDVTGETVAAGLINRADLKPGDRLSGPVLIVEPQTTTLVSRDFTAEVDGDGNLLLLRKDPGEVRP